MEWQEWEAVLALAHYWGVRRVYDVAVQALYADFPRQEALPLLRLAGACAVPRAWLVRPMVLFVMNRHGAGGDVADAGAYAQVCQTAITSFTSMFDQVPPLSRTPQIVTSLAEVAVRAALGLT